MACHPENDKALRESCFAGGAEGGVEWGRRDSKARVDALWDSGRYLPVTQETKGRLTSPPFVLLLGRSHPPPLDAVMNQFQDFISGI